MNDQPESKLAIVESLESYPVRAEREGIAAVDLVTTPEEALGALQATRGAGEVLEQIPNLENLELWLPTAYFSVCRKTGTARYLDIWDTGAGPFAPPGTHVKGGKGHVSEINDKPP